MFGLTAQELEEEPIDQFLLNMFIKGEVELQRQRMEKHAGK